MKQQTISIHKVSSYPYNDRMEIPVIFKLTDEGKRIYDVETMQVILNKMIQSLIDHEKVYE